MIPRTHHGEWRGANRLWLDHAGDPLRSPALVSCSARRLECVWSYDGAEHRGSIQLHGQPGALRASYHDSFHAGAGMGLNGYGQDGVVRLFGTYDAGADQPEWGWQIELDSRDPEAFVLRMFNVVPDVGPVHAVVFEGKRES